MAVRGINTPTAQLLQNTNSKSLRQSMESMRLSITLSDPEGHFSRFQLKILRDVCLYGGFNSLTPAVAIYV